MSREYTPTVLTIAGSDPYGGAGIQVDGKTIHALGGYALSIITSVTAQNSTGVKGVEAVSPHMLRLQLETLLEDIKVDAVKIGMLANSSLVEVVVEIIEKYKLKNIVLDTVMISSSGKVLLESDAINIMVKKLFPCVDLITPNIPEVNRLLNINYLGDEDDISVMSSALFGLGANAVLIKGGHSTDKENATDYLVQKPLNVARYSIEKLETTHTHGTGCVLSSAIATHLALGYSLDKSVELSKVFLYKNLQASSSLRINYIEEKNGRKEPIL